MLEPQLFEDAAPPRQNKYISSRELLCSKSHPLRDFILYIDKKRKLETGPGKVSRRELKTLDLAGHGGAQNPDSLEWPY
jgi:hypothetical protein